MSTKTTIRLTVPPTVPLPVMHQPLARAIAGGVVVLLVVFAFVADAIERRRPAQELQPQIVYQPVYIIATPTPQPIAPTEAPAVLVSAPPTAEPEIVYVPQPVYIEVQAAPQIEAAPAEAWHPPLALPECADWHPPLPYPENCP